MTTKKTTKTRESGWLPFVRRLRESVGVDTLGQVEREGELTAKGRNHVAAHNFALPKERKYPIHDMAHARDALSRSSGKPEEKAVRAAVYKKYPSLKPKESVTRLGEARAGVRPGRIVEAVDAADAGAEGVQEGRRFRVLLITEGLSKNGRNYYGPEAIQSCLEAFEGAPAFIDHPSKSEDEDIPERRVRAKCGYYKGVEVARLASGELAASAEFHTDLSESGRLAAEKCLTAVHYSQELPDSTLDYVGLSINADGEGEQKTVRVGEADRDVNYVTKILPGGSVDIVTEAARGGRVVALLESIRKGEGPMKKLLESLQAVVAGLKAAKGEKDAATAAAKLSEAEKDLKGLVEALEEAPDAELEAMCEKREGESDEEHGARLKALHAHLGKKLGAEAAEPDPEGEPDGDEAGGGDELHAKGKGAVKAVLGKGKDDAETKEARRLAVRHLIAESKIPERYARTLNVAALARVPLAEARAQIAQLKTLVEAMAADGAERVEAGIREKLHEGARGDAGDVLAECMR